MGTVSGPIFEFWKESQIMSNRPNVVFITTDHLRYDTLGYTGDPVIQTPAIDTLAAKSVRFSNCFVQNPVCSPSRASFMTGRYTKNHGLKWNGTKLSEHEITMVEAFKDQGYTTAAIGKNGIGQQRFGQWLDHVEAKGIRRGWKERADGDYTVHDPNPFEQYVRKEDEDPRLRMWMDNRLIRWPEGEVPIAKYMLAQNSLVPKGDGPMITFSHFLSRRDLIFGSPDGEARMPFSRRDLHPRFNFSRVAGTTALDRQVRQLGSSMHIYGHQHRNRCRKIDGVIYVSHCLGYARERRLGLVCELDEGPRLIWQG